MTVAAGGSAAGMRRRSTSGGGWRHRHAPHPRQHVLEQVPQCAEVIERHARVGREPMLLANLTKELRLADAIDPQIRFQIGVELHDLPRIPRLLHHEIDQEGFDLCPLFSSFAARPQKLARRLRQRSSQLTRPRCKRCPGATRERLHAVAADHRRRPRRRRHRSPRNVCCSGMPAVAVAVAVAIAVAIAIAIAAMPCRRFVAAVCRGSSHRLSRARRSAGAGARAVSGPPPRRGVKRHHADVSHSTCRRGRQRGRGPQGTSHGQLLAHFLQMLKGSSTAGIKLHTLHIGAARQNTAGQPAQHAGGPNLDKRSHAGGIQLFNHRHPAHCFGHLAEEALANLSRTGEQMRGGATESCDAGSSHRQRLNGFRQSVGGGLEQRRMEGAGNCQALRLHPAGLEDHLHRIDRSGRSPHHTLLGGVFRTHPHLSGQRFDGRGHRLAIGDHRKHGAVAGATLLNGCGPRLRGARSIREAPRAHRRQGGKFTEAVTGDVIGGEAHAPEYIPRQQIAQIHRPLRVPNDSSQAVARLPSHFGQGLETVGSGQAIERLQTPPHLGRLSHQAPKHVGVLRTLPREQSCHEAPALTGSRRRLGSHFERVADGATGIVARGPFHPRRLGNRLVNRWHGQPIVEDEMAHQLVLHHRHAPGPIAGRIGSRHRQRMAGNPQAAGRCATITAQRGRHLAGGENPCELEDRRRSGGRARVPDRPFQGAGHCAAAWSLAVLRSESNQLLLIAFRGAASTGFQAPNERGIEAGILAGLAHHAAGRLRQTPCCPDRHRANHAMDGATGGPRILEPLQHQHHGPLGRHPPRSRRGKNRAGPVGEHLAASQALVGG